MARETAREAAIQPETQTPIYQDQRQIVRQLGAHLTERFTGKVTGAGGVGGTLTGVPFRPGEIIAINQAGATPAYYHSVFASSAAVHASIILATAANANPPTITDAGDGTFTIGLPTQMAPDTEVVTVVCIGYRDVNGSE